MLAPLIEELKTRGIRLSLRDGSLSCSAPQGAMTAALQSRISEAKDELIDILLEAESSVSGVDPIVRVENQKQYALSNAQRRTAMTSHPEAMLPAAFSILGDLNISTLEKTLNRFVQRHAVLRSRFDLEGREPSQTVLDFKEFELVTIDVSKDADNSVQRELDKLQSQTVRPESGDCYVFSLLAKTPSEHILFAGFSPLVFDGWSFDLFWRELTEGYAALSNGADIPFKALDYSYADCANWLRNRVERRRSELQEFWHNQLGDQLPLDPLPLINDQTLDRSTISLPFEIEPQILPLIRSIATSLAATPQVVLLATLYLWAYRIRGVVETDAVDLRAQDVVLGIAVEGRPHIALEDVVGPFANLVLMRQGISVQASFEEFVTQVRDDLLKVHQYQEFPIDSHSVRSCPGSSRSFQIEFSFQQTTGRKENMGDLRIEQVELRSGTSAVDLTFWVKDWGKKISGAIEFRAGSFKTEEVKKWIKSFHILLGDLLLEPGQPLELANLLGTDEIHELHELAASSGVKLPKDNSNRILPIGVPGRVDSRDGLFILRSNGELVKYQPTFYKDIEDEKYLAPKNDTQFRIEAQVEKLLGKRIGINTDFVSAGLNSLLALRLIEGCRDELSIHINLPTLFRYSNIMELAQFIDSGAILTDAKSLVPIQPNGKEPKLYCICGVNLYAPLALALGQDQPTFGVYVPDERDMLTKNGGLSTAELAQMYWQAIRAQHDGAPLRLLGFCFGGALAYEVAQLARAEGINVLQLVMIDTALSKLLQRQFHSKVAQFLPMGLRMVIRKILRKSRPVDQQNAISTDNLIQALSTRLDSFVPKVDYDGDVVIVDSGDPELFSGWVKTRMVGWEGVLTGDVQYIDLSSTHTGVLSNPDVETFSNALQKLFAIKGANDKSV